MKKYNSMVKTSRITFLAVLVLLLQACTMGGQMLKEANSVSDVSKDEIIIVGTLDLTPKLGEDEQYLKPSGVIMLGDIDSYYKNRALIQFNNKPEESDYKNMINPELGKTFFFKVPRDMKYLVEGSVVMELSTHGVSGKIVLPTWFKVDLKPSDKAVYIGKIKYKRDDFNSIVDMKLIDDYASAEKQFRKKFGGKYKLRKALIKKI